ncbi:uncharacterized protein LOC121374946 [Gigantopelta aegis]|uniref:uncharacterized protein LOC121374946 n=1 Tax=Gigantopelta aegis TaxID=1735272 RepID=UPI001B88A03C|nr:uncharacterized protein LOC121374946 [Gigantopelta aegis]
MADEVGESYRSSLSDLKFNSKPLINMLTMLAEEEEQNAPQIVQAIEQHIKQVKTAYKLPVLYLIDSIIKNLTSTLYPKLFAQNIVQMFCSVFEEVDEKTRGQMFKLRQTWKDFLPNKKLYALDVRVNMVDPAWPITAHAPEQTTIHVNPKFLMQQLEEKAAVGQFSPTTSSPPPTDEEELMRRQLMAKEQELQKIRLELELAETKAKLQLQRKQLEESQKDQKVDSDRSIWQVLQMNPLTSSTTSTTTSEPKPQPTTKRDPRLASRDPRKARNQAQLTGADKTKSTPASVATPSLQLPNQASVSASIPHAMNIVPSTLPNMIAQNVASVPNFTPHFQHQGPFINAGMPQSGFPPVFSGTGGKPTSSNMTQATQLTVSKAAEPIKPATKAQLVNKTLNKHSSPVKKDNNQKLMSKKDVENSQTTNVKENDKKKNDSSDKSKNENSNSKPKDKDIKSKEHVKSRSRSPRDKHKIDKSKDVKLRHERKSPKEGERDRRPSSDYLRRRPRDDDHFGRKDRGKGTFRGHRGGNVRHGDFDRSKHRDGREVNERSPRRSRSPGDRSYRERERNNTYDQEKTEKDSKLGKPEKEPEAKDVDIPMPPVPPIGILTDTKKISAEKKNVGQPLPQIEMPLDVLLPKESEKHGRSSKRSSEHLDIDERSLSTPGAGPDDKRQKMEPLKLKVPKPSADLSDLFGGEDVDYRKSSGLLSMKSPLQSKWNTFKASHPDEYGPEMETLNPKNKTPEIEAPVVDIDMRKLPPLSPFSPSPQKPTPQLSLNIPHALHLDHQEEILIQAHMQLESGQMSHNQHQNLLKQLSQVYNLQRRELLSPGSAPNPVQTPGKPDEVRQDPRLASKLKPWIHKEEITNVSGQSPKQDVISNAMDVDHRKLSSVKQLEPSSVDGDGSSGEMKITSKETVAVDTARVDDKDKQVIPTDVDDRHIKKENTVIPADTDARQVDKITSSTADVPNVELDKENPTVPISKELPHVPKKEPPVVNDPRFLPMDIDSRQEIGADSKSPVDKDFRQAVSIHPTHQMDVDVPVDKDLRQPADRFDRDPMLSSDPQNRQEMGRNMRHPLDKDHRTPFDRNRNPINGDERFWPNEKREFSEDRDFRRRSPSEFSEHDFRHDSNTGRGDMHRYADRPHQERFDQRSLAHRNEDRRPEFGPEGRRDIRDERNFREPRPLFPNAKRPAKSDQFEPMRHPNQDFNADYPNSSISKPVDTRSDLERYDDPRWVTMRGMTNAEVQEEVVIDKRPYEIKVGGQSRKIRLGPGRSCLLYVDPGKRGVVIDGKLLYRFGEPVKDVNINGKMVKLFFHGLPVQFWIDGHQYQLRVDAPPKRIVIDGTPYGFQIDGRDMMILVDRLEKGRYGGPPREILLNNKKHEIRFDPLPREILIDGQFCELKLDRRIPVVIYKGRPHGIRFDGPPRTVFIDDFPFIVPMDDAVKVKIKNRPHFLAFGGPAHEIIIDGKWFEVKFDNIPREISLGSNTHIVRLEGPCPTVKILDEVPIGYEEMMKMPLPSREEGFRSQGIDVPQGPNFAGQNRMPGPVRPMGPRPDGFVQRPMEPNHDGMMQGPREPGPNAMMQNAIMQGPRGLGPDTMMQGQRPDPRFQVPGMQNVLAAGALQQAGLMSQSGVMPQLGAAGLQQGLGLQGFNPLVSQQMQIQSQMPGAMMMAGIQNLNQLQLQQQLLPVSMGGLGIGGLLQQNALATTSALGVPMLSNLLPGAVTTPASAPAPAMDINSLFKKLLATGIIKKKEQTETPEVKKESKTEAPSTSEEQKFKIPEIKKEVIENIPSLTLTKPEDFKKMYKGVVQELYTGLQCTSCGERFSFLQTERYREHLDWHFRKNKRGMDDMKVARNRDWYFKINEWIQYQEIEESEDRGRSQIFEQMMQTTPMESSSMSVSLPQGSIVDTCPAASDEDGGDICCICGDPFDQYWHEEKEDWHLRDAIRVDKKIYHPVCYDDAREEGSIIEATPTPTTDPQTNPLTAEIKSQEEKPITTASGLPQSTLLEKTNVKQEPVTESEVTVKSDSLSSVTVKEEPHVVPPSDTVEKSSTVVSHSDVQLKSDSVALVAVKQEPVSSDTETSVTGAETVTVTSDRDLLTVVKTEPVLQMVDSSQTMPVKTDIVEEVVKSEVK